ESSPSRARFAQVSGRSYFSRCPNDFCWRALFRCFDLLSSLLLLQQLLERIFVMIFELFRRKVARIWFRRCVRPAPTCLLEFFIRNVLKILILFAHLIWISQRNPEQALAARFECDHVLARGEDNPPERHHPFLADCFANDRERLLPDFAIRSEVIGAV